MYSSRFDIATQEIERPLLAYSGRIPEAAQTSAMVKGCRMSALTRRTNECSRPFRADVGQPLTIADGDKRS